MEKKSLSQQTADRLYNMIVAERRMEPGEKLPNEVELARELGVSRTPIREAIRRLPEELRTVVILRYFAGYTLEETAQSLDLPRGTVSTRQRRALQLLRLELGEEGEA